MGENTLNYDRAAPSPEDDQMRARGQRALSWLFNPERVIPAWWIVYFSLVTSLPHTGEILLFQAHPYLFVTSMYKKCWQRCRLKKLTLGTMRSGFFLSQSLTMEIWKYVPLVCYLKDRVLPDSSLIVLLCSSLFRPADMLFWGPRQCKPFTVAPYLLLPSTKEQFVLPCSGILL